MLSNQRSVIMLRKNMGCASGDTSLIIYIAFYAVNYFIKSNFALQVSRN